MSEKTSSLSVLKISAALVGLIGIVQTVLGLLVAFGIRAPQSVHGIIGMAALPIALVATIAAWMLSKRTGSSGLFMHAGSVTVLALAQIGLGELGIETFHIVLGFAFAVAAVALATLAFRKSG